MADGGSGSGSWRQKRLMLLSLSINVFVMRDKPRFEDSGQGDTCIHRHRTKWLATVVYNLVIPNTAGYYWRQILRQSRNKYKSNSTMPSVLYCCWMRKGKAMYLVRKKVLQLQRSQRFSFSGNSWPGVIPEQWTSTITKNKSSLK